MTALSPHTPVMLREAVAALTPKDGGVYVDGTFGRGGYSAALLESADTKVYGFDRDPAAIAHGRAMETRLAPRLTVIEGAFGDMERLLADRNVRHVDGVVFDLGVSSPQLDEAERGFSFRLDGPLDMRMAQQGPTAADLVNTTAEADLARIIFDFGDERYARRVARRIAEARQKAPIARTGELAAIVRAAVPKSADGVDPATRTFQALRIAVNDELGELQRGLGAAERLLAPGGRLAVVSFHSLEDRRVKDFIKARSDAAPRSSRHAPMTDGTTPAPTFRLVTRKPVRPADDECDANPRARSARLRIAERTASPAPKDIAA